jgi:outer membrane protein OmpA-like peptidoglycan-associated protein
MWRRTLGPYYFAVQSRRSPARIGARLLLALAMMAAMAVGCGGSGKPSAESTADSSTSITEPSTETTVVDASSGSTLPAGAAPGLDDYGGDGVLDPTCGTQDFGAGLVLRIPCVIDAANGVEEGTTLVEGSLYRLPGSTDIDLTGISGSLVLARDAGGAKLVIVVFNTDGLFELGSAEIGSTDTLDGTIRLINRLYPGSTIQVRGHTDSTGSAGANLSLSERRATAVADYLKSHGLDAAQVTAVGLGNDVPLAQERDAAGADSVQGRRFNRRVEIVIRPK